MPDSYLLIACLCAEWCGVCRDYRARFEQVAAGFPQARFVWIDVEDEADLVDPIDVTDFPTLLIAAGDEARFFGTVTPRIEALQRLVADRVASRDEPALERDDLAQLVLRLRGLADDPQAP